MRILVTGATGFVGAQMVRVLLAAGVEVAALVSSGGNRDRLDGAIEHIRLIEGRLSDVPHLKSALAEFRPDACIHLAWYAEPGKYLYAAENVPTLQHSLMLLETLIAVGCPQVVMVGTCAEYDTDVGYLREDSAVKPATIYAACKLSMCQIGQFMAAAAGINFAWGRLFYLYGPMEDQRRLVPALMNALRRGEPFPATVGEQVRDYLHVEDVASALWILAREKQTGIFNIASGMPITIRQLMETTGEIVGHRELIQFGALPYRQWEPLFICGDNRKLKAVGWTPKYALREGLAQTAEWWARH